MNKFIVTIILISIIIGLMYFSSEQIKGINAIHQENYNNAKNQTLSEINSNTTTVEKIKIITFNCEAYEFGSGWVQQCKRDLAKNINIGN